jgi:hypothetical protein
VRVDVFLVPIGDARYELYCEVADSAPVSPGEERGGIVRRIMHRFRETLAAAEREHRERQTAGAAEDANRPKPFMRRMRDRMMRWMAERIAEQRLLWHLRGCEQATLVHPEDVAPSDAMAALRRQLTLDYERHRRWFVIDLLGFVASGAFMLVPGPNVIAYYFLFRFVGHFLSMRGARQGLRVTTWRTQSSPALTDLRGTLTLHPADRTDRLRDIASRLGLTHLASFVERMAA